jgi:hypothetical protein
VIFVYFNSPQPTALAHGARGSLGSILCQEAGARALGARGGPSAVQRQETGAGPRGTWQSQSCRGTRWREMEPRRTRRSWSWHVPGAGAGATGHVVVPKLPWGLMAGARAMRHVVAPELPCARRWEPRETQACELILSFIFDLELVHGGTRFSGYRHISL